MSRILKSVLKFRLAASETALKNKKVFVYMPEYDLSSSEIRINDKSDEGGYIRSGLTYKIPDTVDKIRFFVYWNDTCRVDIDLHAVATTMDYNILEVGWDGEFDSDAIVFSGDITHSDAAEYIDIDLTRGRYSLDRVTVNLHLFDGGFRETFREVKECFVGAMAVSELNSNVELYSPKNCFFSHNITNPTA